MRFRTGGQEGFAEKGTIKKMHKKLQDSAMSIQCMCEEFFFNENTMWNGLILYLRNTWYNDEMIGLSDKVI